MLFFIELSTRRVEVGGIVRVANGLWMTQIARNLTDPVDGFFIGKRYLIHDRDRLYTGDFLNMSSRTTPPVEAASTNQSPNCGLTHVLERTLWECPDNW